MKEPFEFFHKVPTGFFVKYPQQTLNVAQFYHKPSKNPQRAHWAHCDQIAGYFAGYFSKVPTTYLLGLYRANWWVLFESIHYLPAGYEPGELFQNPQ